MFREQGDFLYWKEAVLPVEDDLDYIHTDVDDLTFLLEWEYK